MLAVRAVILLLAMTLASGVALAADEFILTAPAAEANAIARRHGLVVLSRIPGRDVFLVRGPEGVPPDEVIARVLGDDDDDDCDDDDEDDDDDDDDCDDDESEVSIELDIEVTLPESQLKAPLYGSTAAAERALLDRRTVSYYGASVWTSHARQPAVGKVGLAQAHQAYGTGAEVVAVIDSGVDHDHPALAGAIVGGYDFTTDTPGGSELGDLGATHPILNPTNVLILDNDAIVPINPSTQVLLEPGQARAIQPGSVPATFGHGTMVASLVRLVAPSALIMPLKAFDGNGVGRLFNVVRALYHADVEGARVINLSLSLGTPSAALADAVFFLHARQRFVVAAAGNDGRAVLRYPAAYPEVFGIGSVTPADRRSRFSNFGADLVAFAAPGEAIVAAYPSGQYALAWGTSFSTPLAAGSIALMLGINASISHDDLTRAFRQADPILDPGMGLGRLNIYRAVGEAAGVQP